MRFLRDNIAGRLVIGVTITAAAALGGCDSDNGKESISPGRTTGPGDWFESDACRACVDEMCVSALASCRADAVCEASLSCFEACDGSQSCIDACDAEVGEDDARLEALGACVIDSCASECGVEDEPSPPGGDVVRIEFQGGLHVHPTDAIGGENTQWGTPGIVTGASSVSDGATNTARAVQALGANNQVAYAARLCERLESLGFTDWYLPSRDELQAIFDNRSAIPNLEPLWYWASTEDGANNAWIQNFADGFAHAIGKQLLGRVRCVRRGETLPAEPPGWAGDASCRSCVESDCASQLAACQADAVCAASLSCFEACEDSLPCREVCDAQVPDNDLVLEALGQCVFAACAEVCQLEDD